MPQHYGLPEQLLPNNQATISPAPTLVGAPPQPQPQPQPQPSVVQVLQNLFPTTNKEDLVEIARAWLDELNGLFTDQPDAAPILPETGGNNVQPELPTPEQPTPEELPNVIRMLIEALTSGTGTEKDRGVWL